MAVLWLVVLPFLGAFLPFFTKKFGRNVCSIIAALTPLIAFFILLNQSAKIYDHQIITFEKLWMPVLGLNIKFRLDGLSYLFSLIVLGIGLLVIIYARYYLSKKESIGKFYTLLLIFMGSMLGVVLSGNILQLIVFWELTSISSFILIGFWGYKSEARKGARMALTITGAGGLSLLAGLLIIGNIAGSFDYDIILTKIDLIQSDSLYPVGLILILIGAFTKSAQFPFHIWLPHAMAAPTPVSAYLHSATMVKAGVFLLARLYPILSGTDLWFYIVTLTGLITMLWAAIMALFQNDIKGLLAYSTISHLGLITLLFGLDTELATIAAIFHIINHAIFKASLFMTAGVIDHETGTRDMLKLKGLWKYMKFTGTLAIIASASMAGIPLFNGFLSKEMMFAETLNQNLLGSFNWIIPAIATFAASFSVAYSTRFIHDVFFNGDQHSMPKFPPHEPNILMRTPILILIILCLIIGIVPSIISPLLKIASIATINNSLPEFHVKIWHGFNGPFVMSLAALAFGALIYKARKYLYEWYEGLPSTNGNKVFDSVIKELSVVSGVCIQFIDNKSLQRYLVYVFSFVIISATYGLSSLKSLTGPVDPTEIDYTTTIFVTLMSVGSIWTVFKHSQRLISLMVMGIVGLMVIFIFVRYSAIDLALTQISIEVVTIILLMLVIYFLPNFTPKETQSLNILKNIIIAIATGSIVGMIVYAILTREIDLTLAKFFLENTVTLGGGANAVNVIIVDFRGFDTWGESTVLSIAGIVVYSLLYNLSLPHPKVDANGKEWSLESHPVILNNIAKFLMPLAIMVSIFIFMRGHNAPGGGFIAGLITSIAIIIQYIANGINWTQKYIKLRYHSLIGSGIALIALTGSVSFIFNKPFLTHTFGHWNIHLIGELELASAMSYDLGVYLSVVGATLMILSNFAHISRDNEIKEFE